MQEITVQIRFDQPCLGTARRNKDGEIVFCLDRNPDGHVMLLPSWWNAIMRYAARLLNCYYREVREIRWDPAVDGQVSRWRRYMTDNSRRNRFAYHEAFTPGTVVTIHCALPTGLPRRAFRELLDAAGRYEGISPYKGGKGRFGTFQVVDVQPRYRLPPDAARNDSVSAAREG